MAHKFSVLDALRAAVDQELFGRHSLAAHATSGRAVRCADVVQQWRLDAHHRHFFCHLHRGVAGRDVERHVGIGGERGQSSIIQPGHVRRCGVHSVVPVILDDAVLARQGVLERRVKLQEAVVVFVENVVDVIRGLSSGFHVLGVRRHELNRVVGRRKNTHQRRHDGLHCVAHVHADHLAAAILLVAKRLAAIVFRRLGADRGDRVVDEINSVVDLTRDDALQLRLVHVIRVD